MTSDSDSDSNSSDSNDVDATMETEQGALASSASATSTTLLDPQTTIASLATNATTAAGSRDRADGQSSNSNLRLLDPRLVRGLVNRLGLQRPTLVQSHVWPAAIQHGRSCIVQAPTGSGKTVAYAVPVVQQILSKSQSQFDDDDKDGRRVVQAVILVPTRELCSQVEGVLKQLVHYCDDHNHHHHQRQGRGPGLSMIGVLSIGQARGTQDAAVQARQWAALRDAPAILVATPSALQAALQQYQGDNSSDHNPQSSSSHSLLSQVHTVVMDEADLLLSLGYEADLRSISQALPRRFQGLLVSATLGNDRNSTAITALPTWMLTDPAVTICVEQDTANGTSSMAKTQLKQLYLPCPAADKFLVLYVFLKLGLLQGKGLFFVGNVNAAYRLKLQLQLFHIRAAVLNAELPTASRLHILQEYHVGNMDYLIATNNSSNVSHGGGGGTMVDDDDDNDNEADHKLGSKRKRSSSKGGDVDYGVSRGVDFYKVSFVVNVDLPSTAVAYRHAIGRTARAGRAGVALSLVRTDKQHAATDLNILEAIQADQPRIPLAAAAGASQGLVGAASATHLADEADAHATPTHQAQPVLLDFDLQEMEGFRYRVEDVCRAVTRKAIREARTAELKAEILNSERLAAHFAQNPADARVLQHDKPTSTLLQAPAHLRNVPRYLLPAGMTAVANLHKKRKRKKRKTNAHEYHHGRNTTKDPLQSFQADDLVNLDGVTGNDDDDFLDNDEYDDDDNDEAVAMNDTAGRKLSQQQAQDSRVFTHTQDGTGKSTAGRNAWKERHRKGKYSGKKRKSERRSEPLGI